MSDYTTRHLPQNVNLLHRAEQAVAGFNRRLAVRITEAMGTMQCAYLFALLALCGFPGLHATASAYVQWLSQTFIQLTALSVIMVGQSEQNRHAQLQADEQFATTQQIYRDNERILALLEQYVLAQKESGTK